MGGSKALEEGSSLTLDYSKIQKIAAGGSLVVPVAVQDFETKELLILAYVNELALQETIARKICVLWSTSRNELWVKGATSGDTLELREIRVNCEQNSLLYLVTPKKTGACHTRDADGNTRVSCYYRRIIPDPGSPHLQHVPSSCATHHKMSLVAAGAIGFMTAGVVGLFLHRRTTR